MRVICLATVMGMWNGLSWIRIGSVEAFVITVLNSLILILEL